MEDKPKATGAVYVLSNAAMERYIKIGRTEEGTTESVVKRMRQLDAGGVPLPFDCEHASAVEDAPAVEKALHEAFGGSRVRSNREFFTVEPFRVVAVLKLLEIKDITPPSEQADTPEDGTIKVPPPRPSFRFAAVGIPNGATLQWADDPTIDRWQCRCLRRTPIVNFLIGARVERLENATFWHTLLAIPRRDPPRATTTLRARTGGAS